MIVVTNEINFLAKRNEYSISTYKECLEKYSTNFDDILALKTETPIFLDTNVLLRYYSISFSARQKLYEFIESNKNKIIITHQVQYEFLKNREDVIQKFFEQVTNRIPKEFNSEIVNKMKAFLDQHKIVLKDYPFVEEGIQKHQEELSELLKKLNEDSEKKRQEHTDLIFKDKFLDLLNECVFCESLQKDEIEVAKKSFDVLSKNITTEAVESIIKKNNSAFPGLGDIREKPEDPYGDFIIFHEIMKYMISNKKGAIFLTFDNTKGDWMSKSKSTHLHYIQNMYSNTGEIIYIFDAERTLEEVLNTDIKSLVTSDKYSEKVLNVEALEQLFSTHDYFSNRKVSSFPLKILIEELNLAGYNNLIDISNDLMSNDSLIKVKLKKSPYLSQVGALRVALRINNPNYKKAISSSGVIRNL